MFELSTDAMIDFMSSQPRPKYARRGGASLSLSGFSYLINQLINSLAS